jgi:RHS repeat-associated protein
LEFFPTAEGYVKNTAGSLSYVYQYKDHLGNVRLSYAKNTQNALEIIDETHYYPFGLKHQGYVTIQESDNKYKYNGKELQDELGLGMYDMEARNYMPDIGRWGNLDALAESFFKYSPYNFSNNNPTFFADPSGLSPESTKEAFESTIVNQRGKVLEHRDDGDPGIYMADFGWREGDSTNGLSLVGFEKPGVKYNKGYQVVIDLRTGYGFTLEHQRQDDAITPIGGAGNIFGIFDMLSITTEGNSDLLALLFIMRGKAVNSSALGIGNEHHLIPVAIFKQLKDDLKALMKLGNKKNLMSLTTPFHGNHPQFSKYVKKQITDLKEAGSLTKESIESLQTNLRAMINKAASEYEQTGKNLNEYFRQFNKK